MRRQGLIAFGLLGIGGEAFGPVAIELGQAPRGQRMTGLGGLGPMTRRSGTVRLPLRAALQGLHAQFHQLAGRILQQATSSGASQAARSMEFGGELDQLLAELIGEINEWRDDVTRASPIR